MEDTPFRCLFHCFLKLTAQLQHPTNQVYPVLTSAKINGSSFISVSSAAHDMVYVAICIQDKLRHSGNTHVLTCTQGHHDMMHCAVESPASLLSLYVVTMVALAYRCIQMQLF